MMTNPELPEPERSKRIFALFDNAESCARDRTTILDAGGQASRSWLVPDSQAGFAGKIANVLFGETGIAQRSHYLVLLGRDLTWAEVALIVEIETIGDGIEILLVAKTLHNSEEFVFAVKAASSVVTGIFRSIEFGCGNDFEWNVMFAGERDCVGEASASQAGRVGDHGKHVRASHLVGRPREERGIDAAGIGNQSTTKRADVSVQRDAFSGKFGGVGHGTYLSRLADDL